MEPEAAASERERMPQKVRRGMSWNLVAQVSTNALRLVMVVVLGRLIPSHDFGVVAAALSVIAILTTVRDIGIGQALIQRARLGDEHTATAFAVSVYLGIGLAAVVAVTAPLVARLYHAPECTDLLRVLGLIFVFRGLATTSQILCQREMDFRTIALIDTCAYAGYAVTSIAAAVLGLGPWALVVGYLVEEVLSTSALLILRPPRFAWRIDRASLRDLLGFGAGQTTAQIFHTLAVQGDNIVVGNRLGSTELGFYTRAYDLIKLPAAVFSNVVGTVLFPAFSRLQGDRPALGTGFRRLIFANALVLLPASAVLVALAPEAIRILMGPDWDAAVLPFQILAATMMMRVSYKVGSTVASAAGAVYAVAAANVLYAAAVMGGALATSRWGIAGVAVSTGAAIVVMYLLCSRLGMQQSDLGWRRFGWAHAPGGVAAVAVGAAAWPAAAALRANGAPAPVTFAAVAGLGVVIAAGVIAIGVRRGRGDFAWLGAEIAGLRARLHRRSRR